MGKAAAPSEVLQPGSLTYPGDISETCISSLPESPDRNTPGLEKFVSNSLFFFLQHKGRKKSSLEKKTHFCKNKIKHGKERYCDCAKTSFIHRKAFQTHFFTSTTTQDKPLTPNFCFSQIKMQPKTVL